MEALPVGIVLAVAAADGGEEALGCRVGADHQRDVAEAGEDLCPRRVERLRAGRACGVAAADAHTAPSELLCKRGPGDEARVSVADGVRAGDVLDVLPLHVGVGERSASGNHAVLGEVAPPLAPRVHADPEDRDVLPVAGTHGFTGAHT